MDAFAIEREIGKMGYSLIAGVDEAGRGPLAGDVFAAAVILPDGAAGLEDVNDSKKLSAKKREALYDIITKKAVCWAVGRADILEIEEINIENATYLAMNRAIAALSPAPDFALIDGGRIKGLKIEYKCIIKGDLKCVSIAAASILAKVSRDRYMAEISKAFPEYGFERHKGYGTAAHIEAIKKFGPSKVHRISFLGKII